MYPAKSTWDWRAPLNAFKYTRNGWKGCWRAAKRERERGRVNECKRERELEDKRGEHGHVENARSRYLLNYYEQLRTRDGARKSTTFSLGTPIIERYCRWWGFKTLVRDTRDLSLSLILLCKISMWESMVDINLIIQVKID